MSLKVIGIGEVLWDLLPSGPQLGGAPANFTYHARELGASAVLVTRVGSDNLGSQILARFKEMDLSPTFVQLDRQAPTSTVTVALSGKGVPQFTIHEDVAWDRLAYALAAGKEVGKSHAVCFGSLAQRNPVSRAVIQQLVSDAPAGALRVFDVNLRQNYYSPEIIEQSLRLANVLKLNDGELPILAEMFELERSPEKQIEELSAMFDLKLVAVTRGAQGSLLYQGGRWSDQPPQPVAVVDTVGAGDAFTAAMVMGLLQEMDLDEVHSLAAEVARYVCSCAGATPPLPPDLRRKFLSPQHRKHGVLAKGVITSA